jgi:ornithine carbamoyltransferase
LKVRSAQHRSRQSPLRQAARKDRARPAAPAASPTKRDFVVLSMLSSAELDGLLRLAIRLKAELKSGLEHPYLRGRTLAMIFLKPSLRTRITFETGMAQLGGHAVYLAPQDIGLGERESVKDVARNLSRWVDLIMIRCFAHETCAELAREATVPVINGLTDLLHPCQLLADLMTLHERFADLRKLRVAFVGDGFNVAHSLIEAAELAGFELRVACPHGYEPREPFATRLRRLNGGLLTTDPAEGVKAADVVYTDSWISMGQESEAEQRRRDFEGFQVNGVLLRRAKPKAVVMHCLPAHRGEEITEQILDGPRSLVLDQAENRLHAQKAVMLWLLKPEILGLGRTPWDARLAGESNGR